MNTFTQKEITQLLVAWNGGDKAALDQLVPLVYEELRQMAKRYMKREKVGHVLQTTALVNEVYLKLIDANNVRWEDRAHFFAISAQLMRRILVDIARHHNRAKRGGELEQITLEETKAISQNKNTDLVALDEALTTLAQLSSRQSKVVELKFFGGLNEEEIAEVLKISVRTVRNDWSMAKVWLLRELSRKEK